MKKLVLGMLAHVDSGKTTLSEGMLYTAGDIRTLGRVDHKNAFLDIHTLERERGITIFAKQALLHLENTTFTLLDTPGHVDFSAETERTLQVLDYAILLINGAEGIQSHTETLWQLLRRYQIPTFLFVNKMDLSHFSRDALLKHLSDKFSCVDFSEPDTDSFFDALSMCDEAIMNAYLEHGAVEDSLIQKAIKARRVVPCFFGSALKTEGISSLLSALDRFTAMGEDKSEFGAKVFKISEDEQGNRLTHMKITSGHLRVKDLISVEEKQEKVNQIRIYSGKKFQTAEVADMGTICAVTGLSLPMPGQGLGIEPGALKPILEPVLTYRVEIMDNTDVQVALKKLRLLEQEDPELHLVWNDLHREIHVRLMGEIQLEILRRIAKERLGLDIAFTHGSIAYKETIAAPVRGVGHFEPLRHYAEVHLLLEPGEAGSGVHFASDCSEDVLARNWQRLILTHLKEKTHRGVLTGAPITDMKITLLAGRAHVKHTEGGDFREATYRAVRHGLMQAQSVLLEPWYAFVLTLPGTCVGRAMTDLEQMGARISPPELTEETAILRGCAPVYFLRDYHTALSGYTKGQGKLSLTLSGYEPCTRTDDVVKELGYDAASDTDNTPDSVFCAHGSGFAVPWYEVENHMHIKAEPEKQKEETRTRVAAYIQSLASDKELMQIFERTYGPIRHQQVQEAKLPNAAPAPKKPHAPKKTVSFGPEYLLVDGYNIIFAWDELKTLAAENLDLARNKLIHMLCNFQGVAQCNLILVFDAYKVKGNQREVEKIHNISVVYTKEAETADMYIEKVSHELSKNHRVRVATSDGVEQLIILAGGALRVSAESFYGEVKSAEKAIADFMNRQETHPIGGVRSTEE